MSEKDNPRFFLNTEHNFFGKKLNGKLWPITSSGLRLTNNEIKDIKAIKPLENREILLKGTTGKTINSKGGFLSNALETLMAVGLPLMKNILTPSAKSVLIQLALTAVASATDAAIQTQIYG